MTRLLFQYAIKYIIIMTKYIAFKDKTMQLLTASTCSLQNILMYYWSCFVVAIVISGVT